MIRKFMNRDFFEHNEEIRACFDVKPREVSMHAHEFWEISYVYEGRGTHYLGDGRREPVREGEFVVVSPGAAHGMTSQPSGQGSRVRVCNLMLTQNYMDRLAEGLRSVREFDEFSLKKRSVPEIRSVFI